MPDGGTFAPDGNLFCAPCTGLLRSEAASMVIAVETRKAAQRKEAAKAGAAGVAGLGVAWLVVTVLLVLALTAIAARVSGCVQALPRWIHVG
jgi:hypothetical protein